VEQHGVASRAGRLRSLGAGDACLRGTAFGYVPVRLLRRKEKKLRAVTGAVICRNLTLIHGRGMMRHKPRTKGEH
jgi:hypothetical protein